MHAMETLLPDVRGCIRWQRRLKKTLSTSHLPLSKQMQHIISVEVCWNNNNLQTQMQRIYSFAPVNNYNN